MECLVNKWGVPDGDRCYQSKSKKKLWKDVLISCSSCFLFFANILPFALRWSSKKVRARNQSAERDCTYASIWKLLNKNNNQQIGL